MRIGNRNTMHIVSARMARIAKTRGWQAKTRIRTSSGKTGGIKNSGTRYNSTKTANLSADRMKNSYAKALMELMNGNTAQTRADQILQNQQQMYQCDMVKCAAQRINQQIDSLAGLCRTDETDQTTDAQTGWDTKTRKEVEERIKNFVRDYNVFAGNLEKSTDVSDRQYLKKLKEQLKTETAGYQKIGITVAADGRLVLDEKRLRYASAEQISAVCSNEAEGMEKIKELVNSVLKNADKQIENLKKEGYALSSTYNKYGTAKENSAGAGGYYNVRG